MREDERALDLEAIAGRAAAAAVVECFGAGGVSVEKMAASYNDDVMALIAEVERLAALLRERAPAGEPVDVCCPECGEEGTVMSRCTACGGDWFTYEQSMAHTRRHARENPEWRARYVELRGREPGARPAAPAHAETRKEEKHG